MAVQDEGLRWILEQIKTAEPAGVYVTTKEQCEYPDARWTVRHQFDNGESRIVTDFHLREIVHELLVLRAYRREMTSAIESVKGAKTCTATK
jgi:hypothetical protein